MRLRRNAYEKRQENQLRVEIFQELEKRRISLPLLDYSYAACLICERERRNAREEANDEKY